MTEALTKEQMKAMKNKEAVAAMKSAKSNMEAALHRIENLEHCIEKLISLVDTMMKHIPEESFAYNSTVRNRDQFKKDKLQIQQWY